MRIAYFDVFAGIAGDMVLGAFISAGVEPAALEAELAKLGQNNFELKIGKTSRSGITATKVDVVVDGELEKVEDLGSDVKSSMEVIHGKVHDHEHHHHHRGRSYLEIKHLIEVSRLAEAVKSRSLEIFRRIAEAEAMIHDKTIDTIHFHEVGAIDSIVDIVGTSICLELAGVESVYTSPIRLGSGGYFESQHGVMPVPGPAAVEILKNYPVVFNDVPYELTTPTGAGIVAALSKGILKNREVSIDSVGYGAGSRDLGRLPNLLRLVIGKVSQDYDEDHVVLVETNMDDINPQVIPHVIEKLLSIGATDAFVIPLIMKKGRPGFMLSVLTSESLLDRLTSEIFSQTTTLGVRISTTRRMKIQREVKTVDSSFGKVKVKESYVDGHIRIAAEFEECKRIAEAKSLPLVEVMQKLNSELNRL